MIGFALCIWAALAYKAFGEWIAFRTPKRAAQSPVEQYNAQIEDLKADIVRIKTMLNIRTIKLEEKK